MSRLAVLRTALPEHARDVKLNLEAALGDGPLTVEQRWGVAVAAAATTRNVPLIDAVVADARTAVGDAVVEDGLAAATLMAMTNVFYRFRHLVGKESYGERPPRLRMNRLGRPATRRIDMELYSLVASVLNGCGQCVRAHEAAVVEGGLGEEHVHEAVRIAATIQSAAVALPDSRSIREWESAVVT